jgi:hypothetical protein
LNSEILSLAGPILTAMVTLLGAWWKETQHRRSREQVRQRLLTQVKDEIGMIEAWAKAHASLGSSAEPPPDVRERAQRDLDVAYARMAQLAPELRQPVTLQTVLSRLFLRHLRPTLAVRLLRYLYYAQLVMVVLWGLAGFSQPTSWSSPGNVFGTLGAYSIVAIIPAWLLATLILTIARRQAAKAAAASTPAQRTQPVMPGYDLPQSYQPVSSEPQRQR